ncbi:Glycosyl hydrolases family 31 protein [Trichomonas vaginalis G3]|uniref:Glycosyl hydrolases family 31 protein n=1 Tax=Trichomonas vaginalis (strain ATCC PRA-98 / G3) TaxID=412133 RepID=A2DCR1_TRIV3|nr:glycosyl hydrolase [Trichomonas vaginalis G3]EAY21685.1 Glycosyl hydrolases family 31 protein [Trichomonas vaginalis G3]KAI5524335.1 alpha-glucosidase family [Trichomonas vaginalis G3]|eukprot:XP_001582671.1 glycosyl hydrolase [Trichomonas vaginalis G3]
MSKNFEPLSDPASIVQWGNYRITVLTNRCIRIEYNSEKKFVDQATISFINRKMPVVQFESIPTDEHLTIKTDTLTLIAKSKECQPNEENFQIFAEKFAWKFGTKPEKDLFGTIRTLDMVTGSCPLGPGLISRDGFTFYEDKSAYIFEDGSVQPNTSEIDCYFFGYDHDYKVCLHDFLQMSGKNPIISRYAYGIWWSRYWPYTSQEMINVADEFIKHNIPLSVYVIDMDWHCDGWTGYTWNKKLIPDPQNLLDELHKRGLQVTMNLHPAEGIQSHEMQYEKMAKRMGVTPPEPVKFCGSDPKFMTNYFDCVLHPLEEQGVDFWWIDWQQQNDEKVDPLITLNNWHFKDNGRKRRPLILSRWCGLGGQRYPIGFSGDTFVEWSSLQFQPYFTSTAANIGFNYWSHDIGGHYGGHETGELYLRWVQTGALFPILRMHSNRNIFHERLPWGYEKTIEELAIKAMQFHCKLTPLFYSLSFGDQIIKPMYYDYQESESAYNCPSQFLIGNDIIACPITNPIDKDLGHSFIAVWLPDDSLWFDYQTGRQYKGGWHMIYGNLSTIPLFVRAGGLVPLQDKKEATFEVFPCGETSFTVIDDDGGLTNGSDSFKTKVTTKMTEDAFEIKFEGEGNQKFIKDKKVIVKIRQTESEKVTFENCRAEKVTLENNTLTIILKSYKYPFTIKHNLVLSKYEKPLPQDIFNFIKPMDLEMWVKFHLYQDLEKNGFIASLEQQYLPPKLLMHLLYYTKDCGFYEYPDDTGVDASVIFSNCDDFEYNLVRVSDRYKVETVHDFVPKNGLIFRRSQEKAQKCKTFDILESRTDLTYGFGPFTFKVEF